MLYKNEGDIQNGCNYRGIKLLKDTIKSLGQRWSI